MTTPATVYVAASWRNPDQPDVVRRLRALGITTYDFRNPTHLDVGFAWSEIDPAWRNWTPKQFREALTTPTAVRGFRNDMEALRGCQVCLMLQPSGVSAALELGWAAGAGKHTIVMLAQNSPPELMLKMADRLVLNVDAAVEAVREWTMEQKRRWDKNLADL